MANESERFYETKETAVDGLTHFAARHCDGETALAAAHLSEFSRPGNGLAEQVAHCLREVSRVLAARFDAITRLESDDVCPALVSDVILAVDTLDAVRAFLAFDVPQTAPAERATAQFAPTLEGLAWVEAAESIARLDGGCAELALALLYLRGSLAGDRYSAALNLAEALAIMTKDQAQTLDAVLEADGAPEVMRDRTGGAECERRAMLLASGWAWLRKLAAT